MKINLLECNLFKGLDEKDYDLIAKSSIITHYKQGDIIHFEEDVCEAIELIISGNVKAEQVDLDGNVLVVREFKPGSYIGTNAIYSTINQYMLHIVASEDSSLYRIPKYTVETLLKNERFRLRFLTLISDNTMHFGKHIKLSYRQTLRQKIINFLKEQQLIQKSNIIRLNTSKTNLAMIFGVERTSLSRELQKMKKDGFIVFNRSTITIMKIS
ncbi:MAG: Crp/Fnr family transcriptional regulator [Candidatus Izemoplasmatales bacterium]|nr:Crp/Fnr family transcriptional regulator [Candidatus Izemoplasmatales bacterium]